MAISLNDHESRIKTLEGKIGAGFSDTGWINGTPSSIFNNAMSYNVRHVFKYRVMNNVAYLVLAGNVKSAAFNAVLGTLPNWKYGELVFLSNGGGDQGGNMESRSVRVDSSGKVYLNVKSMSQWGIIIEGCSSCPLTIYYIVRYNIYKLVRFLSHLNTKFGGERR